jgi:hypothetical protein
MPSDKTRGTIRLTSLLPMLMVSFLATACVTVESVYAQPDFNAYLGNTISDGKIDGIIGSEWDDAGNHPTITIEPHGTAEIWTKHDGTYFYIAMQFTADSANPWVAFQFDRTNHMSSGADGAIFGHDRFGANEYGDISFSGLGIISADSTQNGVGAIRVGDSNLINVELKKPLDSGDSAGSDIEWSVDNTHTLIIMWDSNGGGSSGGSSSHMSGFDGDKTVLINMDEIPEFPGSTLIVVLIVITILVIILKRRIGALVNHRDRKNAS